MTAAGHTSDLRSLLVPSDCHIGGADALTFFRKKLPGPSSRLGPATIPLLKALFGATAQAGRTNRLSRRRVGKRRVSWPWAQGRREVACSRADKHEIDPVQSRQLLVGSTGGRPLGRQLGAASPKSPKSPGFNNPSGFRFGIKTAIPAGCQKMLFVERGLTLFRSTCSST